MDIIKNAWEKFGVDCQNQHFPDNATGKMDKNKSELIINKMRRKIKLDLILGLVILSGLIAATVLNVFNSNLPLIGIVYLSVLLLFFGKHYLNISGKPMCNQNTKTMLINCYNAVVKTTRFEKILGLTAMPAGIIIAIYMSLDRLGKADMLFSEPLIIVLTIFAIFLGVFIAFLTSNLSTKWRYKTELDELKSEIERLSENN